MFITFQQDLINVNHVVSISPKRGVTQLTLVAGKVYSIPTAEFEADILPLLPMLKPQGQELIILPPVEVQVENKPVAEVTEPEEAPKERSANPEEEAPKTEEAKPKPRSRSRKNV